MSSQQNTQKEAKEKSPEKTKENTETKVPGTALILPGAVAKGSYEAGVISVLAQQDINITRIIGTSSGALNAVAYAAGIRVGKEKEMAAILKQAWIDLGSWHDTFNFKPLSWFRGRGMSDQKGLLTLLRTLVKPAGDKGIKDFELRIIVASLDGIKSCIGHTPATTYEKVLEFNAKDFDTEEGLEKIFQATTAACSFPILFEPQYLEGLGNCFDGGAVNNTPIQYALDDGDINHIILPVPFPILMTTPENQHGVDLLNHSVEILINERLFRDLKNAHEINLKVRKFNELIATGVLNDEQASAIKRIYPYRDVHFTQIRPAETIGGGVFSGFLDKDVRMKFIDEGIKAAQAVMPIRTMF